LGTLSFESFLGLEGGIVVAAIVLNENVDLFLSVTVARLSGQRRLMILYYCAATLKLQFWLFHFLDFILNGETFYKAFNSVKNFTEREIILRRLVRTSSNQSTPLFNFEHQSVIQSVASSL